MLGAPGPRTQVKTALVFFNEAEAGGFRGGASSLYAMEQGFYTLNPCTIV
jgi:hypothetical protein